MTTSVPAELERKTEEAIGHYPAEQKRSASLPLLHLWQEHFGFISDPALRAIRVAIEPQDVKFRTLLRSRASRCAHGASHSRLNVACC